MAPSLAHFVASQTPVAAPSNLSQMMFYWWMSASPPRQHWRTPCHLIGMPGSPEPTSHLTRGFALTAGPDPHEGLNNNCTEAEGSPESNLISTKGGYELGQTPLLPPTARNAGAEARLALLTADTTWRNGLGSGIHNMLPGKTKANSKPQRCSQPEISARQLDFLHQFVREKTERRGNARCCWARRTDSIRVFKALITPFLLKEGKDFLLIPPCISNQNEEQMVPEIQ